MDTLIITANLGHLKAFRVVETPNRGRKLELVEDLNFPEAHGRFSDKVTDLAGRFPSTQGAGITPQMGTAETLTVDLENERRLIKLVAEKIEEILNTEKAEGWQFAARPEIRHAIVDALAPDLQRRILRSVQADLTKVPASEVLSHFAPGPA